MLGCLPFFALMGQIAMQIVMSILFTLPTGSQFYNMIPMLLTVKEYYLLKRKLREYNYLQLEPSLSVLMVNQGLLKYFELKKISFGL